MEKEIIYNSDQAMQLAISEAYKGAPFVSPNPLVGCVVLNSQGQLLSKGYHQKYGEAHAEINAIKNLTSEQLVDATVYVTLEPCAHQGKTGSCAETLKKYKLKKVVYGLQDPNPLVSGQGAKILDSAGIKTELYQGILTNELENLAEIFLKNFRSKKTFVAMKVASSLDGQIALANGESQWISTEASREYVHELRSHYDAILVGRKTIEIDNPSLNIRHFKIIKENKLIILDPFGTLLTSIQSGKKYKFLEMHKKENIFFAVKTKIETEFQTITFTNLQNLMNQVFQLKIMSIFVEGGANTYSSFFKEDLVDRLHLFMNASVIGQKNGLSWTSGFGLNQLSEKKKLSSVITKSFGQDLYLTGRF